jgi:hypothetical protein
LFAPVDVSTHNTFSCAFLQLRSWTAFTAALTKCAADLSLRLSNYYHRGILHTGALALNLPVSLSLSPYPYPLVGGAALDSAASQRFKTASLVRSCHHVHAAVLS